jgi:hypothetical protein
LDQKSHAWDARKSVQSAVISPQKRQDHSGRVSGFKLNLPTASSKRTDRIDPALARIAPKQRMLKKPNVETKIRPDVVTGAWFPYPTATSEDSIREQRSETLRRSINFVNDEKQLTRHYRKEEPRSPSTVCLTTPPSCSLIQSPFECFPHIDGSDISIQ